MVTTHDAPDVIRVPLQNRWKRTFAAVGLVAALALGAWLAAYAMPETKRFPVLACALALALCGVYIAVTAVRLRTFPDFALTFRAGTIRFPAYPLVQHRHQELVYTDITLNDELINGTPFLVLVTARNRFRIALELLPPEWTADRIAELITQRKRASRG